MKFNGTWNYSWTTNEKLDSRELLPPHLIKHIICLTPITFGSNH